MVLDIWMLMGSLASLENCLSHSSISSVLYFNSITVVCFLCNDVADECSFFLLFLPILVFVNVAFKCSTRHRPLFLC